MTLFNFILNLKSYSRNEKNTVKKTIASKELVKTVYIFYLNMPVFEKNQHCMILVDTNNTVIRFSQK